MVQVLLLGKLPQLCEQSRPSAVGLQGSMTPMAEEHQEGQEEKSY